MSGLNKINNCVSFIQKISNYYPIYLSKHQNFYTKLFHLFGEIATLIYILWCFLTRNYLLLFFSPIIVYPLAWFSHFYFEKNKPATFNKNPLYTKFCNIRMSIDFIRGRV